jgi:sortase (surface protein transpeptidase)
MKYFYLNIFFIFVLFIIFSQVDYSNVFSLSTPVPTLIPIVTPTPIPTQAPPVRLIVPKLSIDTSIESVSVGTNNIMEVPDGWDKAGWYTKAVKPGEVGTAVIVGHYDDQFGKPAIFYYLNQLEAGDKIIILTGDNRELNFIVKQKSTYPFWSSIDELLIPDKNKNLILITCGGWWNQELHNYSERLVVQAVL